MNKSKEKSARELSRTIYKAEHGDTKPNIWACDNHPISTSKKANCEKCGDVVYYDGKVEKDFGKGIKKVCLKCVLKYYKKGISAFEKELIEMRTKL